jgi:hypothetical protein
MTRWFLGAFCAGAAVSIAMSGCMELPSCGAEAQNGVYAIGDPVNFNEAPAKILGGRLVVDSARNLVRVVYPNEESFVEFRIVSGIGGQGGSN